MFKNLSKQTIEFIMKGYEGLAISFDDFFTKDILIKTDMVMDACYPSWGGYPNLKDQPEILRLINKFKSSDEDDKWGDDPMGRWMGRNK